MLQSQIKITLELGMVPHIYDQAQDKASGPKTEVEISLSYMENGLKR